jgi:hypothetical protein
MAEPGSWPSIEKHGLLSTSALLDLFEVRGAARKAIESCHRPHSVTLEHPRYGTAVIRDQKPMSEGALRKCLVGGLQPADWYRLLNRHVFFWLSRERLDRLLGARAYRSQRHTILEVDTAPLIAERAELVMLTPINTGSTIFKPQKRGPETFLSISRYPYESWRKKRGPKNAVVELAVASGVPNIRKFVVRVTEEGGGKRPTVLLD